MDSFDKCFLRLFACWTCYFFYHSITWAIPSMCNLKLKKCSINIIQSLHSVYIHIEDVHLLLYSHKQRLGGIKESRPSVCLSIQILYPGIYQCIKMHTLLECFAATQVQTRYWSYFNLLLSNNWANMNQAWQLLALGSPHYKLYPIGPNSIQDGCCYQKEKFHKWAKIPYGVLFFSSSNFFFKY
jgi:hypothetical protein